MTFIFRFPHLGDYKEFGPYRTQIEAKAAFQRRYGYWPHDPVNVTPYLGGKQPA